MRFVLVLALLFFVSSVTGTSGRSLKNTEPVKMTVAGGWFASQDVENEASPLVNVLRAEDSFIGHMTLGGSSDAPKDVINYQITKLEKQVVNGMNYKLTLEEVNSDDSRVKAGGKKLRCSFYKSLPDENDVSHITYNSCEEIV